jgi:proton glutamate symport protein
VTRSAGGFSRTAAALGALVAGFALGIVLRASHAPWAATGVEGIAAIGHVWVAAIRLTVIPLVITLTLSAIVGVSGTGSVGGLGGRAMLLFLAMLVGAGLITFALVTPFLSLYPVDGETAASFQGGTVTPAPDPGPPTPKPATLRERLQALLPSNIFQAAAAGEVLPILLFTAFFGLAVTRLPPERRDPLQQLFRALADTMMVLIGWILKFLPLGVFALCLDFAFRSGTRVTGVIAVWIVLVSAILLTVTVLLYPVTALAGRVPILRFARAVAPAQVVAVSTRSSLASLPALVRGGQKHLALPTPVTGLVLPLSVSVFKLNLPVSGIVELLFLGHIFHVDLGPGQVAAFFLTQLVLSFSTAGIPSLGTIRSIPAYAAAGIPLEAVLMLNAVETVPDIFKTLLNVTGDMSAATILSRRDRRSATNAEAVGIDPASRII